MDKMTRTYAADQPEPEIRVSQIPEILSEIVYKLDYLEKNTFVLTERLQDVMRDEPEDRVDEPFDNYEDRILVPMANALNGIANRIEEHKRLIDRIIRTLEL